jgi:hypothetical protein
VPRSLFEIVEARREEGLSLRDLRTGDVIEVQERALTRTTSAGQVRCMRVLPDGGGGSQICGGVISVRPGDVQYLLELLDSLDPTFVVSGLVGYVLIQAQLPELQTTDGEPLVQCVQVYEVPNALQTKDILDRRYELAPPDRWLQTVGDGVNQLILATLELSATTLTVTTMSEDRIERIAPELARHLPAAKLLSDERTPLDQLTAAPHVPAPPDFQAMLTAFIAEREEQWCDGSVPALGGLTPREAAADPTRRGEVVRLIESFDTSVSEDDLPAFRSARLRGLLGLV